MSRSGLIRLSAAAFGAALLACALPAPGYWPLAWVGLAPLIVAVNAAVTRREAALTGFIAGFSFHAVAVHWVYETCRFALMPLPVSAAAWVALCAVLALNWAAAAVLADWLSEIFPRALRPWIWALSWTAVAVITERWTARLNSDLLIHTQIFCLAMLQASSWGGPHLAGFSIALVNASLAEAWQEAADRAIGRGSVASTLALALALAGGLWAHGVWTLIQRPGDPGPTARVEILQPCVDQYRKWDAAYISDILKGYDELLSRPRPQPPVLVVWPETAIPRWVERSSAVPEVARWAVKLSAPQLVGIVARPQGAAGAANAAQLVAPDGGVAGFYSKRELLPFGEFVPLRSWVPRVVVDRWLMILDQLGDLKAGEPEQALIVTPWGKTAVTICYEAIFPRWSRRDAARGARLLVNLTNDGWYKDTWAPRQHMGVNVLRAVENRIPVIRAGNTGISVAIDPWGVTIASLDLNHRGRLDVQVPLADPFPRRSFYTRHGDWFGMGALVLVLCVAIRRTLR